MREIKPHRSEANKTPSVFFCLRTVAPLLQSQTFLFSVLCSTKLLVWICVRARELGLLFEMDNYSQRALLHIMNHTMGFKKNKFNEWERLSQQSYASNCVQYSTLVEVRLLHFYVSVFAEIDLNLVSILLLRDGTEFWIKGWCKMLILSLMRNPNQVSEVLASNSRFDGVFPPNFKCLNSEMQYSGNSEGVLVIDILIRWDRLELAEHYRFARPNWIWDQKLP